MRTLCLLLLECLLDCSSYAQDSGFAGSDLIPTENIDGLLYKLNHEGHTAMLANANCWEGYLSIPEQVAFESETYIVDRIEWLAFYECSSLTKVRIPKTVSSIVHYAGFEGCTNPFLGCTSLESIEVDENSPMYMTVDGILFNKDGTRLYSYPGGMKADSYTVPGCVKWIGDAFVDNEHLVTLKLPETIEKLYTTFRGCTKLEKVNLPENMTCLEAGMFDGCLSLKTVKIPSSVTIIGDKAFSGCSSLESITLPENINEVGSLVFWNCTSLEEITIPSSLKMISNGMFLGCTNLKNVTIEDGVTAIIMEAFADCLSLKELLLPASIKSIGVLAFRGCKFDHLIIRGKLSDFNKHIFDGMDTSTTIYTPASQVKEIQKIYDGVVLPLEDYTGIQPTKCSSGIPSPSYDPQGRLKGRLSKGLYIQNGRKVMLK